MDKITLNISSSAARRLLASELGATHTGDRDVYAELGYPGLGDIDFGDYWGRYRRQGMARRIVRVPVLYTWRKPPVLRDGKFDNLPDTEGSTPFLDDWRRLERTEHVLRFCRTVDRLAGIGRYAVLLLGLADGQSLDAPVTAGSLNGPAALLYLNAFTEGDAEIKEYDEDPKSTRFGQPVMYSIKLAEEVDNGLVEVHWSRVIHVAEETDSGVVFGTPRLEAPWNDLINLDKAIGGSAEAAWINANRGLHVDIRDGFELDPDQADGLSDEIDEYLHRMRRVIRTTGANVNALGSDVPDPGPIVSAIIDQIAAATDIPQRVLIGSERGELASNTDQDNLQMIIEDRQIGYAGPVILQPLIDRLILFGVLQEPTSGEYQVDWPPVYGQKPEDVAKVTEIKARTAKTLTDAGSGVVAAGKAAGFSDAEAQSFLSIDLEETEQ